MGGLMPSGARGGALSPFFGSDPKMAGSAVSNPSGPARMQSPEDQAAAEAAQAKLYQDQRAAEQARHHAQAQGFMGSMMPGNHMTMGSIGSIGPAPPPQWTYQPGKGPIWQTPERTINRTATNPTEANWKMTDSKPGFGGNRF